VIIRGEPRIHPGRPIGMSASRQLLPATSRPDGLRATPGLLAAGAALAACALLAGCSASGLATASSAPATGRGAAMGVAAGSQAAPEAGKQNQLPALLPASQAVIYTANLTVRAGNVRAAAARAARLAGSAGGYVSSETAKFSHRHPADGTIAIQLKIPVARYQAMLVALSAQLGTRLSLSQQAQDVTQTVADVTSRVASAQAAIAQLRKLLARAGTVSSLLMVQDQINAQESNLEALQSQQRVLAHQTTYGTVSVLLVSKPAPPAARPVKLAGGFAGGLAAGWHALRQVTSWLLTGFGAALPFAAFVILAVYAGLRGRRWLARRRAGPQTAD
jgi:Domain of unknown function (DUF4349)